MISKLCQKKKTIWSAFDDILCAVHLWLHCLNWCYLNSQPISIVSLKSHHHMWNPQYDKIVKMQMIYLWSWLKIKEFERSKTHLNELKAEWTPFTCTFCETSLNLCSIFKQKPELQQWLESFLQLIPALIPNIYFFFNKNHHNAGLSHINSSRTDN